MSVEGPRHPELITSHPQQTSKQLEQHARFMCGHGLPPLCPYLAVSHPTRPTPPQPHSSHLCHLLRDAPVKDETNDKNLGKGGHPVWWPAGLDLLFTGGWNEAVTNPGVNTYFHKTERYRMLKAQKNNLTPEMKNDEVPWVRIYSIFPYVCNFVHECNKHRNIFVWW